METPMMLISRNAIAVLKARQADESGRGTRLNADTVPGRSKWDDAATDSPRMRALTWLAQATARPPRGS
jgi:hypothetical protein